MQNVKLPDGTHQRAKIAAAMAGSKLSPYIAKVLEDHFNTLKIPLPTCARNHATGSVGQKESTREAKEGV